MISQNHGGNCLNCIKPLCLDKNFYIFSSFCTKKHQEKSLQHIVFIEKIAFQTNAFMQLFNRHQGVEAVMNNCSEKILFVEDVARLIGKSVNTIRTCATNKKFEHLIPRPFKLSHSRRLCWFEHDVQQWIKSGVPVEVKAAARRPGRPRNIEGGRS